MLSITYFIIVIVIQSAVIQGIVIDEFADRRDKAEHMKVLRQGFDQASGVSEAKYENRGISFKGFMRHFRG